MSRGMLSRKSPSGAKFGIALAAVIKRAVAQEGELGAVIAEFIDLRVIELDDADELRRSEQLAAALAQTPVGCQAGMR